MQINDGALPAGPAVAFYGTKFPDLDRTTKASPELTIPSALTSERRLVVFVT